MSLSAVRAPKHVNVLSFEIPTHRNRVPIALIKLIQLVRGDVESANLAAKHKKDTTIVSQPPSYYMSRR